MHPMEYAPAIEDTMRLSLLPEMLGGLSHELAQPLNAINLACEVMRLKMSRSDLPDQEKEFFDVRLNGVKKQVTRAVSMLDQFRSFFGVQNLSQGNTNLNESVQRVMDLIGQQLTARGFTCSVRKQEQEIILNWPSALVELAIGHCFVHIRNRADQLNKIEATSSGPTSRKLVIGIRSLGSGSEISFSIDKEFEPMSESTTSEPEISVGMAATREVIRKNGGNLSIESRLIQLSLPQLASTYKNILCMETEACGRFVND